MTDLLWTFVFVQMLMGAFDTVYHHEATERLAWRPGQQVELTLHGVRNLLYAVLFAVLGWSEPRGGWAAGLLLLLLVELGITLWDFVEEDRTRSLPASERVTHTLLTLNYGVILALLVPWLWGNAAQPTALPPASYGAISWFCALAAFGVIVSGFRDLEAARRCRRLRDVPAADLAAALPGRRSILVTGGTGFIGRRLVTALAGAGHEVIVLSRDPRRATTDLRHHFVRAIGSLDEVGSAEPIDAIVNLAGEPISNGPWTRAKRRRILASRLCVTREIHRLVARLEHKPEVLVSGSAIGWYGLRGDETLGEDSAGTACFSRRVCLAWEREARRADAFGVRVILLRTGLVLDRDGGMLARLLLPFEFGLGGRIGHGRQWMSWIHRDDLVRLIVHCLATPALRGAVNATAPRPVTNAQFTAALGRALRRPAALPLPAAPLRLALGDFADELLLGGQRVIPTAAVASGFAFAYPDMEGALVAICGVKPRPAAHPIPPVAALSLSEGSLLR
jgi:uncharacterized protein (TIGR01777 family)